MYYFFQLGFAPKLANLELAHLLTLHRLKFQKTLIGDQAVIVKTNSNLNLKSLIDQSGGVVRAGEHLFDCDTSHLSAKIVNHLHRQSSEITFALSCLTPKIRPADLLRPIKTDLKNQGHAVRYVTADHVFVDPIILISQRVTELIITQVNGRLRVFETKAVTDPFSWAKRDRMRPEVDAHSGVMPPKISRILVNLSLNSLPEASMTFYDPFCGSGTLLAEALMLGLNVVGSDNDQSAIDKSHENLNWLKGEFTLPGDFKLFLADATTVTSSDLSGYQVQAIASESYLGPVNSNSTTNLIPIIASLGDLYQKTLSNLANLIPCGSRLVIALARHYHPDSVKMLSHLIDTCEKVGYTLLAGPIIYGQRHARVRRAIYILEKK